MNALISGMIARISGIYALISGTYAIISEMYALISGMIAQISGMNALISGMPSAHDIDSFLERARNSIYYFAITDEFLQEIKNTVNLLTEMVLTELSICWCYIVFVTVF
jgi:hypothetical protein